MENIICVGVCGNIHLITLDNLNRTENQKCVTVYYTPGVLPQVEGKYENMSIPMTYNSFEILDETQKELLTSYLIQYISDEQLSDIISFLVS